MDAQKLQFISSNLITIMRSISVDADRKWGKMSAQHMVEHVSAFFGISNGKLYFPLVTPPDQLPRYKEFLKSDKQFRENTRAPILPEDPLPFRFNSLEAALDDLDKQVRDFLNLFNSSPGLTMQHPVFGDLDFDDWILLHFKHVTHHLKQFGKELQAG